MYYILAEQYYPIFFSLSFLFFFCVSERKRSRSCCCDYLLCAVCAKALEWKIVTNKKRLFYDCFKTCMLHAERSEIFFSFFCFVKQTEGVCVEKEKSFIAKLKLLYSQWLLYPSKCTIKKLWGRNTSIWCIKVEIFISRVSNYELLWCFTFNTVHCAYFYLLFLLDIDSCSLNNF